MWEDGANLLGRGARLALDGDTGDNGCNYGVTTNMGGQFHPCKKKWRFFNLQGSGMGIYRNKRIKPISPGSKQDYMVGRIYVFGRFTDERKINVELHHHELTPLRLCTLSLEERCPLSLLPHNCST